MKKQIVSLLFSLAILFTISSCNKSVSFNDFIGESHIKEVPLIQVMSKNEVTPAVVMTIYRDSIYLGNTRILSKADLTRPDSYGGPGLVAQLYNHLFAAKQQWTNLISGTTSKLSALSLLGFNQLTDDITQNIQAYSNPPLLIVSDNTMTFTELAAIIATSQQVGISNFRILVTNRADGQLSQEELSAPKSVAEISSSSNQAKLNFAVRILQEQVQITDDKGMLAGPNGEPTMTINRRITGLYDQQELVNHLQVLKKQFPSTEFAGIGGYKNLDLGSIAELISIIRCTHDSDGKCKYGLFSNITLWNEDYQSFLLGPITE